MERGPRFIVSVRLTGEARDQTCDHKGSDTTTAPRRHLICVFVLAYANCCSFSDVVAQIVFIGIPFIKSCVVYLSLASESMHSSFTYDTVVYYE